MGTRTFLFVDQVGSTEQLARLGDRAAHHVRRALLDVLRQATEVHGGEEVDAAGDGLFCAFDGAADAVDAAVAMQQLVVSWNARRPEEERLALRIGVHSGEPLPLDGGGWFGAAVVVASRLCERAAPGQVLVSGLVRALVEPRGEHRFTAAGVEPLKGLPDEVEVFAVGWVPDPRTPDLPPSLAGSPSIPFVGRVRELERVERAWQEALEQGRGLVHVSGAPGSGRSRFLVEAAARLLRAGASVWAGSGQGGGVPFGPWAEALGAWAAATPRAELRVAVGEDGGALLPLVPGLGRLLTRVPDPEVADPGAREFLVADAVDRLAARWSTGQPLLVVLDDLDRADPASLAVLRRVAASRRGGRVLLLVASRAATVGTSRLLTALEGCARVDVDLGGLPEAEARELVSAVAGTVPGAAALGAIMAETQGSPAFVVRMARSMRREGAVRRVQEAVDRTGELAGDLRLWREELAVGLRELDGLREEAPAEVGVERDGTPPVPGTNPYRGLLPFRTEDAGIFAGRDALVAELVAACVSSSFLAVVGPSGYGKSSAVLAGLLPALARGAIAGSQDWTPVVVRSGADPLDALARALAQSAGAAPDDVRRRLSEAPLVEVTAALHPGRRTLVVVDQFEELWTLAEPAGRTAVLDLLTGTPADDGRLGVVVVLRADFYGRTAEHPRLAALVAGAQVLVPPMTAAELRAAVEVPARSGGWLLEPGLTGTVVADVAGEPGALPLLSTALAETWERRRGRSLTLAGYAESGGARGAIAHLADSTLDELPPEEQEAARRLLLRLAAPAEDGTEVARPASLGELVDGPVSEAVLARLADRRLVVLGDTTARLAHEALLGGWPRLRGWLAADREGRRQHRQIAAAAHEWESAGRDDGGLLRGVRLAAADDWRADREGELSSREREFLDASVAARQREIRRARRTTRRFQVLTAVLVVMLAGAGISGGLAVSRGREAATRATEATARGLAAQAIALAPRDLNAALLLAVEGYRRDPTVDTRTGLLTALDAARSVTGFLPGFPSGVADMSVAPGGRSLLVLTLDGRIRRYDTRTWRPEGPPLVTGIPSPVTVLAGPDGRRFLYGGGDGVHLVTDDGAPSPTLGPASAPYARFSPDGRFVVVSGSPVEPGVWVADTATGAVRAIAGPLVGLADVRPGTDEVLVGGLRDPEVRRFRLDGTPVGDPVRLPVDGGVYDLQYTPDGKGLLVADSTGRENLLDADDLQGRGVPIDTGAGRLADLAYSPDGAVMALSGDDGSVTIADPHDGTVLDRLQGLAGGLGLVEWLDSDRLLAATHSRAVVYSRAARTALGRSATVPAPVADVLRWSGGLVSTTGARLRFTDASLGDRGSSLPLSVTLGRLALSPDGRTLAVVGAPGDDPGYATQHVADTTRVALVDLRGRVVTASATVDAPSYVGAGVAFSPDGRRIALGTFDGRLVLLDARSGRPVHAPFAVDSEAVGVVVWSPDGRQVMTGGQDGVLRFVDPSSGRVTRTVALSTGEDLSGAAWLPGRRTLAVASESGQVFLVDTVRHRQVSAPLSSGATQLQAVRISPDGTTLAAESRDGALRLWDLPTGRALGPPLAAQDVQTLAMAYTDHGHLVTGSLGGSFVAWDLDPGAWVATACRLAGRQLSRDEWATYLPGEPVRRTCPRA